jgi:hypothetical protein
MSLRAIKPINSKAAAAADDEFYARHKDDAPPNPLFDEDGNRRKLTANSPPELRHEWMKLYADNKGAVQQTSPDTKPPGQVVQPCTAAPQTDATACKALLEKLQKEAADLADDGGDPIANGSKVNQRITSSYAAMYQRRPDVYWTGAATFVSKQMGCNMRYADSSAASGFKKFGGGILGHNVGKLGGASKKVLVRGNQAIFKTFTLNTGYTSSAHNALHSRVRRSG